MACYLYIMTLFQAWFTLASHSLVHTNQTNLGSCLVGDIILPDVDPHLWHGNSGVFGFVDCSSHCLLLPLPTAPLPLMTCGWFNNLPGICCSTLCMISILLTLKNFHATSALQNGLGVAFLHANFVP
jgi:hypothetical protein